MEGGSLKFRKVPEFRFGAPEILGGHFFGTSGQEGTYFFMAYQGATFSGVGAGFFHSMFSY